jgi:hypothetical protein
MARIGCAALVTANPAAATKAESAAKASGNGIVGPPGNWVLAIGSSRI